MIVGDELEWQLPVKSLFCFCKKEDMISPFFARKQ
jgi:hypothetical protein